MFEKSKWIANSKNENNDGSYLFRKEFTVSNHVKQATLNICGLGYGEYTINGVKVTEDVLTTPFTKFDSTVLYLSYDVTSLLAAGQNTIGAFLGNGWYNDVGDVWNYEKATWRHHPKMTMELDIVSEDNATTIIVSDSSWKSAKGPAVYNHIREGEIYDARLEQDGWNKNGFDDSLWDMACVCRGAGGIIKPADLPPIRIINTLPATYLGKGVYDFGENISGWVKIRARGKRGTELAVHYSELLKENGDIDNEHIGIFIHHDLKHCDKYILKGGGWEEWESRFVYHGFRYVKVENLPEDFEIEARVAYTDLAVIGEFQCGDEMLNEIHQAARRSTLTNFHSIPTDCPHREQNGWTGDALISAEQSIMNFDMIKAYKKWLNDFKDVQRPNGQLPGIIPASNWGYNWGSGPAWDSALILIPWYIYQINGDSSVIEQMWGNMKLYMKYMDSMAEDYIVNYGLGDWCPPSGACVCPTDVTDTAYYFVNARTMVACAALMNEDCGYYKELAANIKNAYRKRFLNNKELEKSQTFLACGIYQGLYNNDEVPEKAEKLASLVEKNGYHIDCGILGAKYIFSALSDNGYSETVYKMVINPEMPSYAYWMLQGMTTLCESWEMQKSCNHHMFSEVEMWFYKHLAGIQIGESGITINPCFLPQIKWVKAKHKDIEVEWNNERLIVKVPRTAKIKINSKEYTVGSGVHAYKIQ